ncbi:P-loop containing nucleoside triphosphate hydrolase protein [Catenaria anguillulae PL171]|uniref:RNA helicase n=1 Tax=Catenaria anguillulae PL171 TaxID=765915 RepID=A0A1Y2HT18_9FUNG|nr:P-loop containing nucleoside triphosphate hydrolase protein [Catenaria anguillulae PL171]
MSSSSSAPSPAPKTNGSRQPLSLEDVLKQKAAEQAAGAKPKFLSKEERQKLALAKRAEEVERIRDRQLAEKQHRSTFFDEAKELAKAEQEKRYGSSTSRFRNDGFSSDWRQNRDRDAGGYRDRDRPSGGGSGSSGHWSRDRDRDRYNASSRNMDPDDDPSLAHLTPQERDQIRARYMGQDNKKKQKRRMNERRFVFDWDAGEDTSRDANPLYEKRVGYSAYGRGHIGGVDPNDKDYDQSQQDNRHWSEKSLKEMKERDWRIFKEDFDIATKGGNIPHPLRSWRESTIPPRILHVIDTVGYKEPTPIQRQAIPIGLQGRDMLGIAETGSGKTLTFLVPLLSFILKLPKITEEMPTSVEAMKFAAPLGYSCVSIVGGHAIEEQSFALSRGCEIVIATPGRLKDCLDRHIVVLGQCMYVVMDEADRMIDMGFEADVTYILDQLPVKAAAESAKKEMDREHQFAGMNPYLREAQDMAAAARELVEAMDVDGPLGTSSGATDASRARTEPTFHKLPEKVREALGGQHFRQTVLYSATMPPQVERLAQKYLRRPATVTIGSAGKAVDTVEQRVEFINDEARKRARLVELINQFHAPIIVFFNRKNSVDATAKQLSRDGYRVAALHGGKAQEVREEAIQMLKDGDVDILLATNVAGRGLDVRDVSLVVNFDMAKNIEEYTHRIGRTGRAGKTEPSFKVPQELANHPDAQVRPGQYVAKRKFEETLYAR